MPKTGELRADPCSRCGASLMKDGADGLCVRCLLTGALTPAEEEAEAEAAADLDSPATLPARRQL